MVDHNLTLGASRFPAQRHTPPPREPGGGLEGQAVAGTGRAAGADWARRRQRLRKSVRWDGGHQIVVGRAPRDIVASSAAGGRAGRAGERIWGRPALQRRATLRCAAPRVVRFDRGGMTRVDPLLLQVPIQLFLLEIQSKIQNSGSDIFSLNRQPEIR
jgi:hypothetical protein